MPQAQTVTIAQALQSNQSGLTVQDTAANIAAALPNPGLVSRVAIFELSGAATIGAGAADHLASLGSKFAAGYPITVQDSVAAMTAMANAAGLALATSRQIIDAAYNLLAAPQAAYRGISAVTLTGTPTLSASQLARLESLPGFTVGAGSHVTFADSLAATAPLLIAHPGWFTATASITIRLDGSQISAGVATSLATLANGGRTLAFTPGAGDSTLNVNAAAHDLARAAASLNRVGQLVGVHITVANEGSAITAADAVALTTIAGFVPAQHTLTVADTGAAITAAGAALFNHGYSQIVVASGNFSGIAALLLDPTLHILPGATVTMTGTPTLTASQIQVLAALSGFSLASGATLTVADTISHILAHLGAMAPATAIVATDSETITAANLTAVASLAAAHQGHFNLAGHTLSVTDTPANLAGLGSAAITLAGGFSLSANGAVTQAQFVTLRDALRVTANGHTVTVSDTAANLLALSGNLALVSATQLSADGSVSAAGAQSLAAEPGFSTGGHVLSVTDTASNLLGLSPSQRALAGHLLLNSDQGVSGAQAQALAALGSLFSANGHALVITDTAANLLALPLQASALATGFGLSADAAVSASQLTALTGGVPLTLDGHVLTVLDTPSNLLALPSQLAVQASAFALSAAGTVTEAQFATLRDTLGVAGNGHTLTVADTATGLLALSGNLALVGATHLSADASVNAAQAQFLASEPNFSPAGHTLTVTDTVAALLDLPPGVTAIASAYALSADATVSAAQFTQLYSPLHVALNGHALHVADTPANLLTIPGQAIGSASAFLLTSGGTVTGAQFAALRDSLHIDGNGHSMTVADSAANLLALSGNLALVSATQLIADANVSAAQAQTLAADPGFSVNGHVLTVIDTASNLLGLPSDVQTLSGHLVLSASQSVNALQAAGLAALGGAFSLGDNTLTVTDTAANLVTLPAGVAAIAGAYALSADASVNAADFTSLYATLHVALNGHALTVSDTPANLLSVPTQAIPEASFSLSTGGTVSEAQFVTLRDTFGVHANGHTLTVSDTASSLLALSGNLALDGATQLSADAALSAAQAVSLAAEPGFSTAGHVLSITDTAANLLGLPTAIQMLSGHLVLSASQSVSAAQATSLAALGPIFSTADNTLTVTDTAANLLTLPSGVAAIAGAYALSTDATVAAAVFATLRDSLHIGLNGHTITVLDTAPNLAALGGSMADASAVILSANGTVSAAGAAVLNADPGFSTAGHTLTIADTVSNLLALGTPLQNLANALTLSANQTASAAQLAGLAAYGIKFTTGSFTLGVADTAANLAVLSAPQLALVSSETMTQSATVSAATATILAGLSGFALGGGVFMTVQDSAANLLGLPSSVLAIAAREILPSGAVTLSAAQAAGLHGLANFSTAGASITVLDSVVNLNSNAGWSAVATFTHVVDTAGALAANAATLLLQTATSVTLAANATILASEAAALSTIGSYATGAYTLTVSDNAGAIAQNEAAIAAVATSAVVNSTAAVNASQADSLALLSMAGKLNFQAGDALTIADTYAALTANGNAAGLALASAIIVGDTAANIVTASGYNWGNVVPTYVLSANATISGAAASSLAALGNHLLLNSHTLGVQDTAANVMANANALTSLGISATVSDTAANIGSQANALAGLGGRLAAVQVTDGTPLSGATAAGLAPLASKLSGASIAVADNAANIDANVSALHTLGAHVAITLSDSAAAIGAHAGDFATLGTALSISLTDMGAVSAAIAAGVATLAARFAGDTSLAVTDTVGNIVTQAGTLAGMGAAIGTLTLAGGTAVSVAQAASLLPLAGHLASGVQLAVSGNTAAIVGNADALGGLQSAGRLGSLSDSGDTAANVAGAASTLNALNATVSVSDTQANILSNMAGLAGVAGLSTVTVSDIAQPVFALSLAQYSADASVLGKVSNVHTVAITDTAALLEADLASSQSVLTSITSPLTIAVAGGAPLVLSQSVALIPAVTTALGSFSGTLQITGADVAHLGAVAALAPASIAMADTTANVGADLASGNSAILAHISTIAAIAASGGGNISLTSTQALAAHVDDNASSVFGKMVGAGLVVTAATVAQIAPLLAGYIAPSAISVSDGAANITAALINPASSVLTSPGAILTLHVNDGSPIVLTEAQDMAAGVNDSAGAALGKIDGAAIDVTGVTAAQLGAVEGQARIADQISLSDTGGNIAGALATLLSDRLNLGPITITSGTVTLTVAQALMAHVADGAGSLVSLLPSHNYAVAGATVAQIASLTALAQAPTAIGVSDSSVNIAADIAAADSRIAGSAASVTVLGGTLTLSDAQANGVITNGNTAALGMVASGQTIDVAGVSVADIDTFAALHGGLAAGVTLNLEVSDTALALGTDLGAGGASKLTSDAAYVHSVTLTAAGGTLTTTQLSAVAGIAGLNTNGIAVPVSGNAANIAGLSLAARNLAGTHVAVSDTGANVSSQLDSLQSAYGGHLSIVLTSGTITVTAGHYTVDQPSIAAITNLGSVVVTGTAAAVAAIAAQLGADTHVSAVQITDTAANVAANINTLGSLAAETTVNVSDVTNIAAATAQALVGANFASLNLSGSVGVTDTGSQIAAMAEAGANYAAFLNARGAVLSADSNVALVDASALSGLGNHLNANSHVINVWDTASHLTASGASAALSSLTGSGLVSGIYLKTAGGTVTLTASNAIALLAISGITVNNPDGSANTITVADTAAHLETNFGSLNGNASIHAIVINGSATVNVATLTDMQTLGAITGAGIALTVADTAANIVAASGVSGASVQASAWNLSASANVSSADALNLAALTNFSAAGHTLTVALGSDTALGSVAAANQLGALGAALIVTGHSYTINGSVAGLTGLTNSGAAVAHVTLSDTLAHLSALSTPTPLLTGTVVVTDAESLTAAQAQDFLALLSDVGVPPNNVSFTGGNETVTDTVANLQAMTASSAWTDNATLQSHFALVANDTAANLDNAANAAFLAGVPSKILSATATVSAANATSLASLSGLSLGGHSLIVSDTAANLLNTANSSGLALATSINLNGAAALNAVQSEQLLQINHFSLTQSLAITDTSANLLDGTLSGLIAGHAQVHIALAGSETMDAQTAASLVSLQGFSDANNMNIVDSSSYLLAGGATAAESMAASVALAGDEAVSANTVLRLSEIPHFVSTGGTLSLAGNDFANAPTLKAIADMGSHFTENGHSLTLTQDDLGLTPTQYAQIQSDGFVANSHVLSAMLVNDSVTEANNTLSLTATGVAGASVTIYDQAGHSVSTTQENLASFTLSTPDTGGTGNFSITETVNNVESAPVVVLTQSTLENYVAGVSASFANSGQIQVGTGEYISLYTAGAALPNAPALVYDPNAHTISLDIPSQAPVVLITLGAATHPASLDPSEILIKHHS